MKLFHKLTIAIVFGITLVMAGNALFQVRREADLFDSDSSHDQHTVGRVLRASVQAVWRADGEQAARRLIADANESNTDLTLRWVSLEPDPAPADAPEVPRERLPAVLTGRESVVRGRLPSIRGSREPPPGRATPGERATRGMKLRPSSGSVSIFVWSTL